MAHRKNIETWLGQDTADWADLKLLESKCTSYRWQLTINATDYEINYSDLGYITLSSLPCSASNLSEIREIYQGDASEQSYRSMIGLLSDNLIDQWI
jgi:hypothetical protein